MLSQSASALNCVYVNPKIPKAMITNPDQLSRKLDALFQKTVQKLPAKNLISCVQSGDASYRWAAAAGTTTDGSRAGEQTPFFIASVDKLINAALIHQQAEKGQISLDTPVAAYLPERLMSGLHVLRERDYSSEITIRHLLTHTSGLADWYEDFPKGGPNLVESIVKEGDRDLSLEELTDYVRNRLTPNFAPQPVQAFWEVLREQRQGRSTSPAKPPRIKTRYTDTGFMLLCAVLMEVTGEKLEDLHQKHIYGPLEMKSTWVVGRSDPAKEVSAAFPLVASGQEAVIPKMLRSVWGVYSSCDDMIAFLKALYSGSLFEKPETRDLMFSGWHRFGFPADRAAIRLPGWPIAYSHGAMHFQLPRLFSLFKPMPEIVGHTGSTGCWLFYAPEIDLFLTGAADDLTAGALPFKYVPEMLKLV